MWQEAKRTFDQLVKQRRAGCVSELLQEGIWKVEGNASKVKLLKEAFRNYRLQPLGAYEEFYENALEIVKCMDLKCSSEDIASFTVSLLEFQGEKDFADRAGLFLSALINDSEDKEFIIITTHLGKQINRLGYKNTKIIIIKGDVGDLTGNRMEGGKITIEGNAGDWTGMLMGGGDIHLEGDYRSLGTIICGGNIYHKKKLIVKDGRRVEELAKLSTD